MQRRKVDFSTSDSISGNNAHPLTSPSKTPASKRLRNKTLSNTKFSATNVILAILLIASLLIGAATLFFPTQVENVELETAKKTKDFVFNAMEMEHFVERQVGDLLHIPHAQQEEKSNSNNKQQDNDLDATVAMELQPSNWVDGEKKLKQRLQVLYERQQQGKDLGVPVLTRWLGEDIPAWPHDGMDEKEWREKVTAKYKEMAETEQKWREEMRKLDERNKR